MKVIAKWAWHIFVWPVALLLGCYLLIIGWLARRQKKDKQRLLCQGMR